MSSKSKARSEILRTLRTNHEAARARSQAAQGSLDAGLPDLDAGDWIQYDDPLDQFCKTLEAVGGRCVHVQADQVAGALGSIDNFGSARKICSLVDSVAGNVDLSALASPHDLADLDFCVAPGRFGVAENGALWVTDESLPYRAVYFIAQHLALVLPADQIVHNLHEAYRRLRFEGPSFGVFISGPSKTADIEQSLVIGAHGARSLTVLLVAS